MNAASASTRPPATMADAPARRSDRGRDRGRDRESGRGSDRKSDRAGPSARMLPDGERLHLNHGPIDLIVGAEGPSRHRAFAAATARFETILQELVDELPKLRSAGPGRLDGPVARRMRNAIIPFLPEFITPMAAVAGSVAEEILLRIAGHVDIRKAWVNNGGDIAFLLTPGQSLTAAMPGGLVRVGAAAPWRGLATSGWRGRSLSLGIADSVTVLARGAGVADAAATMIANRVTLANHPAVERAPAEDLVPDSDLGRRLVTTAVGPLDDASVAQALDTGLAYAETLFARGLIGGAWLQLQGEARHVGAPVFLPGAEPGGENHA